MAFYECTFIVRPDMSANDVEKLAQTCAKVITDMKGKVLKTEQWGLRPLAYPINKISKGHYVMLGLDCPPEALSEMERQMRINEDVIRQLSVKVEKLDSKPSVVLRQKAGEDAEEAA